jgi:hypothetical protein
VVNIGLWFMSDSYFEPFKWHFPFGTTIAGNAYKIVWCDKDETQGNTHTNFKLSNTGEAAMLLTADSLLVDEVEFGPQQTDMGYARMPNGTGPFVIQGPTYAQNNNNVGITEVSGTSALRLFPNPASTAIMLLLDGNGAQDVTISDATGQIVWTGKVHAHAKVDVGSWAPGSYIVRTTTNAVRFMVVR